MLVWTLSWFSQDFIALIYVSVQEHFSSETEQLTSVFTLLLHQGLKVTRFTRALTMLKLISILLCFVSISFVSGSFYKVFDNSVDGVKKVFLYRDVAKLGDSGVLCSASYNSTFLRTG